MLERDARGSYFRTDDPGEPSTDRPRLSVTDEEGDILADLVDGLTVLEIGTGLGMSTRALASTAELVWTFDVDPWVRETVWPELPANVRTLTELPRELDVAVVFIDGDHSTEATAADIEYALSVATEFVLCHDANYSNVSKAFDVDWVVLPSAHGIGQRWVNRGA